MRIGRPRADLSPRKRPAVIVMPLRDVPGTIASAWEKPIVIASILRCLPTVGAPSRSFGDHMMRATTMSIVPMITGLRRVVSAASRTAGRIRRSGRCQREQPQQSAVQTQFGIGRVVDSDGLREDLEPISREIYEDGKQCPEVQRDVERQALIFPSEQPGRQCQMGRTADR